MLGIVRVFSSSRALARRRRPCEPFPRADWVSAFARVCGSAYMRLRRGCSAAEGRARSRRSPTYVLALLRRVFACVPTAVRQLRQFLYTFALIFFHNGVTQRTLETVCVIDDKTKYSARWFPYFWRTQTGWCILDPFRLEYGNGNILNWQNIFYFFSKFRFHYCLQIRQYNSFWMGW